MSDSILEAITTLQAEVEKAKARVRIKNECLRMAIEALEIYALRTSGSYIARTVLDRIEGLIGKTQ